MTVYPRLFTVAMLVIGAGHAITSNEGSGIPSFARQEKPAFSARSELVVLHVMVKDRKGSYVTDLTPDAFAIIEDGQRQPVQFFDKQDAPVTVGLVVDSSGSMSEGRDRLIAAASTFAETSNPEDELFALTFNEHVRAALPPTAPFTADAQRLRTAMTSALITWGRTALYDAISAGLGYVARGRHQVRVLVIVSDGGDNASAATFEDVLTATQLSNTVIYTVAVADPIERDASPKRLKQLAEVSGGEAFKPRTITGVHDVLRTIARDIRNTYTIGYAPADTTRDGRFRRIQVLVRAPGGQALRVRTRQGYALEER